MPIVIDANAIHAFQRERIEGSVGDARSAIDHILLHDFIAMDVGGLCQQEWVDCAGGSFEYALLDWITFQQNNGSIRLFNLCPNSVRSELQNVGLPQKDHKWVRLAIGSRAAAIVTDDVDFFDPTKKNSTADQKAKIKNARSGPCAKMLRKRFSIEVLCLAHVPHHLTPPPPP